MSNKHDSYRQIVKGTTIFGGVQLLIIIISIIRSKFIAILLGPTGMGIVGLLTSTSSLIGGLTSFGLGTSAVKDVAFANNSNNGNRVAIILAVLKRLVWITGLLGSIVMLFLSPVLSQLTFGNHNYTLAFVWLSITLLFNQITSGQLAVLQGLRKLTYLAKANLYSSLFCLLIVVPIYYFIGEKGIVPSLIITSFLTLVLTWYFANKVKIDTVKVTNKKVLSEGKDMLLMGFLISFSMLLSLGASYIIRIYISKIGGVEQVGLYTAGFTIINSYVGMIFTSMGTDYYPRLSAVSENNILCRKAMNEQAEIAILILAPIIIIFLIFIKWIILILYSDKFLPINGMIYWAAIGMLFKAAGWAVSFILLAKGASKLFFWNELIANIYFLFLNVLGYYFMGFTGLGISFLISYSIYLIQVLIISKIKYQFSFGKEFKGIFIILLILTVSCYCIVRFIGNPYSIIMGTGFLAFTLFYSYKEIDKRIDLKHVFSKILKR